MTQVEIINRALYRAKVRKTITSLSDGSEEAAAATVHYDPCLDELLAMGPWQFSKRRATLATLAGTPPAAWEYQYTLPSGLLRPLFIDDERQTRRGTELIPFTIEYDSSGVKVLYTDQEDAVLVYVAQITDTALFPPLFANVLSWRLAMEFADGFVKGDRAREQIEARYYRALNEAKAVEFDSENMGTEPVSEFEAAR